METAGRAVASVIASAYPDELRRGVLVAAGPGNNGGDGWVAARALHAAGAAVVVAESARARTPDCDANRALALSQGVDVLTPGVPWPAVGIVVDALLGTGSKGAPRDDIQTLATLTAQHVGPVVAVDGPTGVDLTTGETHGPVRAHLTVTFGGLRRGHVLARDWSGRVVVVDIGFPRGDDRWPTLFAEREARSILPPFDVTMHKGTRGRVLVIGGAPGMSGAALHAVSAAFGAGAGLVKLASASETVRAAEAAMRDALSLETALGPDVEEALTDALTWADAVVLGPGLGRGRARSAFVEAVLEQCAVPVVIDADALHAGAGMVGRVGPVSVLTPHDGEFRAAFPDDADALIRDRFAAVRSAATATGATVLLKGVPTLVAAPTHVTQVVAAGNPALATGGSGDLLCGFIAAYLARGVDPGSAACLGAFTLGRAADLAAAQHTARATRPADVLAALPELWRRLSRPQQPRPPVLVELQPVTVV